MEKIIEVVTRSLPKFQQLSVANDMLTFETGGYMDLDSKKIIPNIRGIYGHIESASTFPPSYKMVNYHTHPKNVVEQFPEEILHKEGLLLFPSHTDVITAIGSSLHHRYPVPDIVVSSKGVFIYRMSRDLLRFILNEPEEQIDFLIDVIQENLGYLIYTLLRMDDRDRLEAFVTGFGKVFSYVDEKTDMEKSLGFECVFLQFPRHSIAVDDHIMSLKDMLENLPKATDVMALGFDEQVDLIREHAQSIGMSGTRKRRCSCPYCPGHGR